MKPIARLLMEVAREFDRATELHGSFHSAHEAYAVLLEEVREYEAEVFKKRELRSKEAMREELIQIAAMACRAIVDTID